MDLNGHPIHVEEVSISASGLGIGATGEEGLRLHLSMADEHLSTCPGEVLVK